MGIPFPCGLRALAARSLTNPRREENASPLEWAWAMNAGASVLGSVLAILIAIQFGLNATLLCGSAAYLSAMLPLRTLALRPELYRIR